MLYINSKPKITRGQASNKQAGLLAVLIIPLMLFGCDSIDIPAGKIAIKNDSQDKSYNVVRASGGGVSKELNPGEHVILPKGTTNITLTRQYKDYTRRYVIKCPVQQGKGILIKMIDAHLNRMQGRCETVEASAD